MNVKKSEKSEELLKYEPLDGTPFTIASMADREKDVVKHFVLFGKYKMREEGFDTVEEAIDDAKSIGWDRIMQVLSIVMESFMKPLEGLLPSVSEVELNKGKDE